MPASAMRQESAAAPPLGANEVHVWRVRLHGRDGARPAMAATALRAHRAGERARARSALRRILARYTGLAADALRIEADALGKPRLAHPGAPAFNLSHTDGLALVAVARTPVGIDVERLRPLADAPGLAHRFLAPAEAAAVAARGAEARDAAFLRVWTRKEAVLKASGHGLALDTRAIEVGTGPGRRVLALVAAREAGEFELLSVPVARGWVAALALAVAPDRGAATRVAVRCFDLRTADPGGEPHTWSNP